MGKESRFLLFPCRPAGRSIALAPCRDSGADTKRPPSPFFPESFSILFRSIEGRSRSKGGESFPSMIGEWIGKDELPARALFRVDGADREIFRRYLRGPGNEVQLYVGYFDAQRQGKEIVNDRTKGLHAKAEKREIVLSSGRIVLVNRTVLSHPRGDRNLLFWYEAEGEVRGNPFESKWAMVKGSLLRGRTNGAFVVVSGKANPETDEASLKEMEALAQALFSLRGEPAQ